MWTNQFFCYQKSINYRGKQLPTTDYYIVKNLSISLRNYTYTLDGGFVVYVHKIMEIYVKATTKFDEIEVKIKTVTCLLQKFQNQQ